MNVSKKKMLEVEDAIYDTMAVFRAALMDAGIDTKLWSDLDTKAIEAADKIWSKQKVLLGYK